MKTPPSPAVTLRLSSHSFLDTILTDTHTPVYSIETDRATTVLCRCTPHGLARLATVNWPEGLVRGKGKAREAVPTVDFDGRTLSAREILRPASIPCPRSTHKFRAAGHPHSFKWYKSHGVWQCKSRAGALVALLDPRNLTAPLRLNIYPAASLHEETYFDIDGTHTPDTQLVDMLVLTALLLVTPTDAWSRMTRTRARSASTEGVLDSELTSPVSPSTSEGSETAPSTPVEERSPTPEYFREDESTQDYTPYSPSDTTSTSMSNPYSPFSPYLPYSPSDATSISTAFDSYLPYDEPPPPYWPASPSASSKHHEAFASIPAIPVDAANAVNPADAVPIVRRPTRVARRRTLTYHVINTD